MKGYYNNKLLAVSAVVLFAVSACSVHRPPPTAQNQCNIPVDCVQYMMKYKTATDINLAVQALEAMAARNDTDGYPSSYDATPNTHYYDARYFLLRDYPKSKVVPQANASIKAFFQKIVDDAKADGAKIFVNTDPEDTNTYVEISQNFMSFSLPSKYRTRKFIAALVGQAQRGDKRYEAYSFPNDELVVEENQGFDSFFSRHKYHYRYKKGQGMIIEGKTHYKEKGKSTESGRIIELYIHGLDFIKM